MSQNMQKKDAEITFVNNNSKIQKQRFDCAGASGSRVKAPRNRSQINKKGHANENSTRIRFSMKSDLKTGQTSIDFVNYLRRFCMSFLGLQKSQGIFPQVDSRRGHLGHITDKGGTGRHPPQVFPPSLKTWQHMPHGPRMPACWKSQVSQSKHIVNVCFYLFVLAMCFSLVTNYTGNISGNET